MAASALTAAELQAARQYYEAGASFREVGQCCGLSMERVRRALLSLGVQARPAGSPPLHGYKRRKHRERRKAQGTKLPRLSAEQLREARLAYEAGATFQALGERHGVSERTMVRLLRSVGVDPRPRGTPVRELPVELILAEHAAGMSAREIARKHGVGAHNRITAILRDNGQEPHHQGRSRGNRAIVLGRAVTSRQARLRRRPPITIPLRTGEERLERTWTAAELEAIDYEIRAGRYQVAPRGQSGLPEPSIAAWQASSYEFYLAMRKLRRAA